MRSGLDSFPRDIKKRKEYLSICYIRKKKTEKMREGGDKASRDVYTDVSFRSGIKYSEETAEKRREL